jgi:hypothetical protein
MTDKTDYRDLLVRYIAHVRRLERGRDLLEDGCMAPFTPDEVRELRRLGAVRMDTATGAAFERTGGDPELAGRLLKTY